MGSFHAKQFLLHDTRAYTLLISRPWKKIHRDQYCSKFNLSTIAPAGEGLNFKEQTITVHKMCVENNASTSSADCNFMAIPQQSCQSTLEDCLLKT